MRVRPGEKYRPLLLAALALLGLPLLMPAIGLTVNTATVVVLLCIAVLGLNMMMGYTGLVSFGHGAWFGIGGYAAAICQREWLNDQIILPTLFAMGFVALLSAVVGALVLRRRGVYFALMTLALSALTYTIAFRWTELTGGEDGLGGLRRGHLFGIDLDDALSYYFFVAGVGLATLFFLRRVTRSPFGHVLLAIRENQQRAIFQGYPVQRYKLGVFVLSAVVTALAGALSGFQHYIVTAEPTSVEFSGELLAMVVIGGMHNFLGPAIGVLFYILFREFFSMWTADWLFWFGLVFVAFVLYSPGGLVGIWGRLSWRWRPLPEERSAMSGRTIHEGLPLPGFLQTRKTVGKVLEVENVSMNFGGIRAVSDARITVEASGIHALIGPNGAGKTTLFNVISGLYTPKNGAIRLHGENIAGLPANMICGRGLARSFQITHLFENLTIYENLRLSVQAQHSARFDLWRDIDRFPGIHDATAEFIKFLGLAGIEKIKGGDLSYGGQRLVDLGIALASRPKLLLLDEPLAGLAAAERERIAGLIKTISDTIPILIVEHDIDRVLGFSDRVTVMNQGTVLVCGSPEEVRENKKVQAVYTGTATPQVQGRRESGVAAAKTILAVDRINTFYGKSHILNDASLNVRGGEIVALLGRNGAGKSTLLKSLAGLVPARSGQINFDGVELRGMAAPDVARLGVGYVPQGRGIFAGMTVAENLSLGRLARATDGSNGVVWDEERIFATFPILRERYRTSADFLSGGEQQMLAVARALAGNVRLLLLDEPFEGLAPAVVKELFSIFDTLRREVSIIIVEHNLDLVLALADRVFALENGSVFHEGAAREMLEDIEYRKKILWL